MGIGGCGVSCEKLGRKFIGVEVDATYYNIAKTRIQDINITAPIKLGLGWQSNNLFLFRV